MWDLIIIKRKQMLNTQQYRYLEIISHHISFWESNLEIGSLQSSSWLRRAGGWYWKQRRLCQYWRCVQLSSLQQLRKQRCFCVNSNGGRGKSKDWRLKVSFIKTSQCLFYLKDLKNVFRALGHIFSWKVHCSSSMPQPVFVVLSESSSKLTIRCNLRLYLFGTMLIIILYCTIHIVLSLWSIANTEYTHSKDL